MILFEGLSLAGCQVELSQEAADHDGQTQTISTAAVTQERNPAKEGPKHTHAHTPIHACPRARSSEVLYYSFKPCLAFRARRMVVCALEPAPPLPPNRDLHLKRVTDPVPRRFA